LRHRQRLKACKRGLRASTAADIGGRVGEIGQLLEWKLRFELAADTPERKVAIGPGIHEGKLERGFRPAIERGILGTGGDRRPIILKRAAQRLAVADQVMQARDRAILLGFDDLELRAASWAHGWCRFGVIAPLLKARRDRRGQRFAHIQIVGNRQHNAGLRRFFQTNAGGDQTPGVDQHPGRGALLQALAAQIA
jgi:hypothetical protein